MVFTPIPKLMSLRKYGFAGMTEEAKLSLPARESSSDFLIFRCWETSASSWLYSNNLTVGKWATLNDVSNSMPRKTIFVSGNVVLSVAVGTPISSHKSSDTAPV